METTAKEPGAEEEEEARKEEENGASSSCPCGDDTRKVPVVGSAGGYNRGIGVNKSGPGEGRIKGRKYSRLTPHYFIM